MLGMKLNSVAIVGYPHALSNPVISSGRRDETNEWMDIHKMLCCNDNVACC